MADSSAAGRTALKEAARRVTEIFGARDSAAAT